MCQLRATTCIWLPVRETAASPRGGGSRGAGGRGRDGWGRSHPEHAESRFRDRRVQGGGDPEAEDGPRLRGRDHAVVPEARRRIIRTALFLVFREDRGLHRVDLFGGHDAALASSLLLL